MFFIEWRIDQKDAVGWQLMLGGDWEEQQKPGQLQAEIGKVTSLGKIKETDLPMFGLPPSRQGIVHRRQKIDLQGTQRTATLSKRGQRQ